MGSIPNTHPPPQSMPQKILPLLCILLPIFYYLSPSWPNLVDSVIAWGREHPSLWAPLIRRYLTHLEILAKPAMQNLQEAHLHKPSVSSVPRPDDHICIVGAGPAGIHMALSLKDKGFSDVVIFERESYVGGKVLDTLVENVPYPLGAIWLDRRWTSYQQLADRYGLGDKVPVPPLSLWHSFTQAGTLLSIYPPDTSISRSLGVLKQAEKYMKLHRELLGSYDPLQLPVRPSQEALDRMKGTVEEFLEREDLTSLAPLLQLYTFLNGYGQLDEESTFYTLLLIDPICLYDVLLFSLGVDTGFAFPKSGHQALWKTIVQAENLDVRLASKVVRVKRNTEKTTLWWQHENSTVSQDCNFLIWAAPQQQFFEVLADDDEPKEREVVGRQRHSSVWASLVKTRGVAKSAPISIFLPSINDRTEYGPLAVGDLAGTREEGIASTRQVLENWMAREEDDVFLGVSQMGGGKPELAREALEKHLRKMGATEVEIQKQHHWNDYFPRWSPEDIREAKPWKLLDAQGNKNTWLIGGSAAFETIESVLGYNNILL